MEYQSSLIYTDENSDLDRIIALFKKYNIRTFDDSEGCTCYAKVTFNKQTDINIDEIFGTSGKRNQFLIISGERCYQRTVADLFDIGRIKYTKEELELINKVNIIFLEKTLLEYEDTDNEFETINRIGIYNKPNQKYMEIASKIADELIIHDKNVEQYKKRLKEVCEKHGMGLKVMEYTTLTQSIICNSWMNDLEETHDKIVCFFVDDIFSQRIEISNDGSEFKYELPRRETLISKVAEFLETKDHQLL